MKTVFVRQAMLCLALFFCTRAMSQTVIDPSDNAGYDSAKLALIDPSQLRSQAATETQPIITVNLAGRSDEPASAQSTSLCWIPVDNTYLNFPGNDDGSIGPLSLPFSFNLYGTNYTQFWINNNGNLTFTSASSTFTATGFPTTIAMVAPFWSDVDTRLGNTVKYKINPTNVIVTYENVGYYNQHVDKLNTFQVVISNGNDPLIGIGNNVSFHYKDMQWTTGDASGGTGGFGGTPATVGINKGNGSNYVQIGRFGLNSNAYDGGGGATDGINYLDNECFRFNVSNAVNQPPSVNGLPANNTVNIACGETRTFTLNFNPPEVGQSVSAAVNSGGLCNVSSSLTSGSVATAAITITGSACNIGSHTISVVATDNFPTPASTTVNITVNITDNEPPIAPSLPEITGECYATATVPVTTDNCAGSITGTTNDALTYTTQGTHIITWNFDDGNGNSINVPQTVVVDDVTAPTLPSLPDITGECSATANVPTTTDNCVAVITGTTSDPLTYTTQGTHIIVWTFDDGNGNPTVGYQNVIISNQTAPTPVLSQLPDVTGECEATIGSAPVAIGNCGNTIPGVTADPTIRNTQGNSVVTWTFTDPNGNLSVTQTQNIIVADLIPPSINCPSNIVLDACTSTASWSEPAGSDNCSGWTVSRTGPAPGSTFATGTTSTVSYVVTDVGGNSSNCSFTVTRQNELTASIINSNPVLYFGYSLDQTAKITVKPSGGTAPYTVKFTMNRPLNCNVITSSGDEVWAPGSSTASSSNNVCPGSGSPSVAPSSTSTATINSVNGYFVNVTLDQDAVITALVTDANGCTTTVSTSIHAEDVRCFAGNSGNAKITICHQTGSSSNKCVKICVDQNSVDTHLEHGDFLGNCPVNCVPPVYSRTAPAIEDAAGQGLNLSIMPNPTSDRFNVKVGSNARQPVKMVVTDLAGRVIESRNVVAGSTFEIARGYLPGLYFVVVQQGKQRVKTKVVKLRN